MSVCVFRRDARRVLEQCARPQSILAPQRDDGREVERSYIIGMRFELFEICRFAHLALL